MMNKQNKCDIVDRNVATHVGKHLWSFTTPKAQTCFFLKLLLFETYTVDLLCKILSAVK